MGLWIIDNRRNGAETQIWGNIWTQIRNEVERISSKKKIIENAKDRALQYWFLEF